jgi:hypothetical protein
VTETSTAMKFIIGTGAILAVGIPTFIVGQYVSDLRHDMEQSKVEVEHLKGQITQLQDILQKTQISATSGARGPKGDKGDPGDPGPAGPRGERGPTGAAGETSVASAELSDVAVAEVKKLVTDAISAIPSGNQTVGAAAPVKGSAFSNSKCVLDSAFQGLDAIELRTETEVCDGTGRLIATIRIQGNRNLAQQVIMVRPGKSGALTCQQNRPCELFWVPGKEFVVERIGEDADGGVALLRSQL